MRRRPLLRAAAAGGAGYLAGRRRTGAEQENGALTAEAMEQLKSLAQLHDQGILTDQEFSAQKAKVLRG
jgi:hypothetical protein